MSGYMGKLLLVDLESGWLGEEELNMEWACQFVGGSGLACRYLYDLVGVDTDPLGPDNPLLFMTGPLVGTPAPSCGRYVVCARSPLTGIWGEANCSGFFGPELRFAGYDGIMVRGQAAQPVYLWIDDGQVELRDAAHLWGQDTYQTQTTIKEELGEKRLRVACIGPGGENLVKFAAIMSDHARTAGRTGLGAVMGSKKLKAVAVRGSGRVPLFNEEAFREVAKETAEILRTDFASEMFRIAGTAFWVDTGLMMGDVPGKYFTRDSFEEGSALSGVTMAETILTKRTTCYRCPIGCGRVIKIGEGPYRLAEGDGPEYETIGAFGTLLLINNLAAVSTLNRLCNAYGLDTISAGVTAAFAYHLFEQGVIDEKETGGLVLEWGDPEGAITLVKMMARREGFGAILAEGTRAMGILYNRLEEAAQVKGLEIPLHDPRAFFGTALSYATSPRGACHVQGNGGYGVDMGMAVEELGILPGDRFGLEDKAIMVARAQDWRTLYNAMIMCQFANPPVANILALLNMATGWELSVDDLLPLGERIFNIKRALNCRLGLTASDDRLPEIVLRPLEGGTEGNVPNMEKLLADYYQYRGWDPSTGKPTAEKLLALGMAQVAEDLWGEEN